MPVHPAYRGKWPQVRKQILARDSASCQIRGPKCTGLATEVDHIVSVEKGGQWYEPSNLRASCRNCNQARVDRTNGDRWKRSATRITLVIGPPDRKSTRLNSSH